MAWKPWKDLTEDEQIGNLANGYLISVTPEEREWFNSWFVPMETARLLPGRETLGQISPEVEFIPSESLTESLEAINQTFDRAVLDRLQQVIWSDERFESFITFFNDNKFTDEQLETMFEVDWLSWFEETIDLYKQQTQLGAEAIGKEVEVWYAAINEPSPREVLERLFTGTAAPPRSIYFREAVVVGPMIDEWWINAFEHVVNEYLENLDVPGGVDTPENIEDLHAAALNNDLEALAAAAGKELKSKNLKPGQVLNYKQCTLITDLFHNGFSRTTYPGAATGLTRPVKGDADAFGPYLGRILPVDPKMSDPTTFLNIANATSDTKGKFANSDYNPTSLNVKLSYIYTKQDLTLIEIPLKTVSSDNTDDLRKLWTATQEDEKARIQKKIILNTVSSNKFTLIETRISFEGTNPSTARNDVQVSLRFALSNVSVLQEEIGRVIEEDNTVTVIELQNLVNLPVTGRLEGGPGHLLTSQYSPNYNRLRLTATAGSDRQTELIVDLTTKDHSLSRDSETGVTTFEINYRGYFESMMTMPFNDALATQFLKQQRKLRQHNLDEALRKQGEKGCDPQTIREIMRINEAATKAEKSQVSHSSFLDRLIARNKLYQAVYAEKALESALKGYFDPKVKYIKEILPTTEEKAKEIIAITGKGHAYQGLSEKGIAALEAAAEGEWDVDPSVSTLMFYLGDLIEIATDCLYEEGSITAEMSDEVKNLNLKFMVAPIQIPDPKSVENLISINPCQIPIDLGFFLNWLDHAVVKKDLTTYPVGFFIRDLLERLVNDVIYETCFATLLPDERPPLLRVGYFSNSFAEFYKTKSGLLDIKDPYGDGQSVDILFRKDSDVKIEDEPTNYCVVYMQSPPYFQQVREASKKSLKESSVVSRLIYGMKWTRQNYLSNVSFSKTDSPYLQEARYFNDQQGNLSLLANVYDLSFSFKDQKANTSFYPGMIIDFILKDWGAKEQFSDGEDSDPHTANTAANLLGFGGFYIIKSVEYIIGETASDFEITITSKFNGTDAKREVREEARETADIISEDKNCITNYNFAVRQHGIATLGQEGTTGEFELISEKKSGNTGTGNGKKQSEVPDPPPAAPEVQIENNIAAIIQDQRLPDLDKFFDDIWINLTDPATRAPKLYKVSINPKRKKIKYDGTTIS